MTLQFRFDFQQLCNPQCTIDATAREPKKVKVVDTQYRPFVDSADEGLSVLISPGAVQGVLQGG
jgi:hypothetical protein